MSMQQGLFAQIRDVKLRYQVIGDGEEPMVLLMGYRGHIGWWPEPLRRHLATSYRLILVDNRGAGLSERGTRPYTITTLADDVAGLLDHLNIDRAHILGVSMGGMIAQDLAIRQPSRVDRLLLANTMASLRPERRALLRLARTGLETVRHERVRRGPWFLSVVFTPNFIARCPEDEWQTIVAAFKAHPVTPRCALEQVQAIVRWNGLRRLSALEAPALVMTGSADALVPAEKSFELARELPHARLVCLKGQSHGMLYEAYDRLIPYIDEFMAAGVRRELGRSSKAS